MERYTPRVHFQRLEETTLAVKQYIKEHDLIVPYNEIFEHDYTWNKRINNKNSQFLRPLIVRNVLEMVYSKSINWIEYIDIITSTELFNISTYQADEVFDMNLRGKSQKFIEIHKELSVNQYIASYLTYTIALELVKNSCLSSSIKLQFLELMIEAGKKVYEGQHIDAFILRRNYESDPLTWEENIFLKKYLKRCKCLDGYQFAMCYCYGLVTNETDFLDDEKWHELFNSLYVIGMNFGICLQILNDMDDLSYLNRRSFFEDVFNNKVTYPLYLLWHHSDKAKNMLEFIWDQGDITDDEDFKYNLSQIIFENSIIVRKLISLLKSHFHAISIEIKKIKKMGIKNVFMLDFIFPHIFLSRILKSYTKSSMNLNKMLMSVGG